MYNLTTIVSLKIHPPFSFNETKPSGYIFDLVDVVLEDISLNYTLEFSNNMSYNDLIDFVAEKKIEMLFGDITILESRLDKVDFSVPFLTVGLKIIMKKSTMLVSHAFSFLEPFSLQTWLYIVLAYLSVSLIMALVSR